MRFNFVHSIVYKNISRKLSDLWYVPNNARVQYSVFQRLTASVNLPLIGYIFTNESKWQTTTQLQPRSGLGSPPMHG